MLDYAFILTVVTSDRHTNRPVWVVGHQRRRLQAGIRGETAHNRPRAPVQYFDAVRGGGDDVLVTATQIAVTTLPMIFPAVARSHKTLPVGPLNAYRSRRRCR